MTVNADFASARLIEILSAADIYHRSKGLSGCDPRLFWSFPAYKNSLEHKSSMASLLRKIETLSYTVFPSLIDLYKRVNNIENVVSPYGVSIFIQAYVLMYKIHQDQAYLDVAIEYSGVLQKYLMPTPSGNLGVSSPMEGSSGVNLPGGAEAALGMLELYDITGDLKYLCIAEKIADSFFLDFKIKKIENRGACLDYSVAQDGRYVLNANALAIGVLNEVSLRNGNAKYRSLIADVLDYLIPYLELRYMPYSGMEDTSSTKKYDVYHTGFTLRGVAHAIRGSTEDQSKIQSLLIEGVARMRSDFLDKRKLIKALPTRPIKDVHGVAEYIRTLSALDFSANDVPVFVKNIEYMFRDGTFFYQRGFVDSHRYMPRWGHAPMMLAIASLILNLRNISN